MKTIVLTGGGTAGHVTPNIALLPYLEKHFDNIIYIGSESGIEKEIISKYPNIKFYPITTTKLIRGLTLKNFLIPFKLLKGKKEAKKLLKTLSPDIVFSKGGFVSVPVALNCKKLNIPLVIHESDYSIGLANKICKKYAKTVCTTFKDTAQNLDNGIYVGPPIEKKVVSSQDKQRIKNMYNLLNDKPICLILGGSLGAKSINNIIYESIEDLLKTHQILHITGKGKINKELKRPGYTQIEFTKEMPTILAIVDLAITRGGSNSIFELLANDIPMLIIPLAKGSRGDQIQNAKYFEKKGFAICLEEKDLNKKTFYDNFKQLKTRANLMRSNAKYAVPKDSLEKIVSIILKYTK